MITGTSGILRRENNENKPLWMKAFLFICYLSSWYLNWKWQARRDGSRNRIWQINLALLGSTATQRQHAYSSCCIQRSEPESPMAGTVVARGGVGSFTAVTHGTAVQFSKYPQFMPILISVMLHLFLWDFRREFNICWAKCVCGRYSTYI